MGTPASWWTLTAGLPGPLPVLPPSAAPARLSPLWLPHRMVRVGL